MNSETVSPLNRMIRQRNFELRFDEEENGMGLELGGDDEGSIGGDREYGKREAISDGDLMVGDDLMMI